MDVDDALRAARKRAETKAVLAFNPFPILSEKPVITRRCQADRCENLASTVCKRCKFIYFCSQACVRRSWKWHKLDCRRDPPGAYGTAEGVCSLLANRSHAMTVV